ncbi:hypothetical protein QGX11_gp094 [Pseudomonas phage PPSC2]|uniref:Uncharacterized protein n=1 Tax=Pseudomonas phage PPSC2 TaxID=2041350 RepID=A0A2R2YAV6_9CAUD|nr:hypothetical protein QGX11_gp094 [Pseudomonas phage PPSC2]ATN92857.1 hypothetical protein PPSC2_94 [Pseudomonas phage PPSC2]
MANEALRAYYAKENLRTLKLQLEKFREFRKKNTNPAINLMLDERISELVNSLFERTGMRY